MNARPVTDTADAVDKAITEGFLDCKVFLKFFIIFLIGKEVCLDIFIDTGASKQLRRALKLFFYQ